MGKFVLSLESQLRDPKNLAQFASRLKSALGDVDIDLKVKNSRQAQKSLKDLDTATRRANKSATQLADTFALSFKRFVTFSIATRTVGLFTTGLSGAIGEAVAFERELVKIAQVSGKSLSQLSGLTREIDRLSISLGVSSDALLTTGRTLTQAGFSVQDTRTALATLARTDLAPTFGDLNQTTETAIALFNQFGAGAKALESQFGAINAVAGKFAVEAGDLSSAIRRVGGVAKSSGASFDELLGAFTSVRATTRLSAESIATGLRTIFVRLQRPKTLDYLQEFADIDLRDSEGRFVGPFEALRKLNQEFGNLEAGDTRLTQVAETIGGFRQIDKTIPLIQQFGVAQAAANVAVQGQNSLVKDQVVAMQSLQVQVNRVKEEFSAFVRDVYASPVFRLLAESTLQLASSLIKLASSLKELIPIFTAFGAVSIATKAGPFAGNIASRLANARNFNSGGTVPGFGNTDTVPAMLTPGEFVLSKKAVKAAGGSDRLAEFNARAQKLNRGGLVGGIPGGGLGLAALGAVALPSLFSGVIEEGSQLQDVFSGLSNVVLSATTTYFLASQAQKFNTKRQEENSKAVDRANKRLEKRAAFRDTVQARVNDEQSTVDELRREVRSSIQSLASKNQKLVGVRSNARNNLNNSLQQDQQAGFGKDSRRTVNSKALIIEANRAIRKNNQAIQSQSNALKELTVETDKNKARLKRAEAAVQKLTRSATTWSQRADRFAQNVFGPQIGSLLTGSVRRLAGVVNKFGPALFAGLQAFQVALTEIGASFQKSADLSVENGDFDRARSQASTGRGFSGAGSIISGGIQGGLAGSLTGNPFGAVAGVIIGAGASAISLALGNSAQIVEQENQILEAALARTSSIIEKFNSDSDRRPGLAAKQIQESTAAAAKAAANRAANEASESDPNLVSPTFAFFNQLLKDINIRTARSGAATLRTSRSENNGQSSARVTNSLFSDIGRLLSNPSSLSQLEQRQGTAKAILKEAFSPIDDIIKRGDPTQRDIDFVNKIIQDFEKGLAESRASGENFLGNEFIAAQLETAKNTAKSLAFLRDIATNSREQLQAAANANQALFNLNGFTERLRGNSTETDDLKRLVDFALKTGRGGDAANQALERQLETARDLGLVRNDGQAKALANETRILQSTIRAIGDLSTDGLDLTNATPDSIIDQVLASVNDANLGDAIEGILRSSLGKSSTVNSDSANKALTDVQNKLGPLLEKELIATAANNEAINALQKERIGFLRQINSTYGEYLNSQRRLIDVQKEAAQVVEASGGARAPSDFSFALRRANAEANLIGDSVNRRGRRTDGGNRFALSSGSTEELSRVSADLATRFSEIQQALREDIGAENRVRLENEAGQIRNFSSTLIEVQRSNIQTIRESIDVQKRKNELERQSLKDLLSGDINDFFKKQAAVGAQAAAASGNDGLLRSFGAEAIGEAINNLEKQREEGTRSVFGQDISSLIESLFSSGLASRGIDDPRQARLAAETDLQTRALREQERLAGQGLSGLATNGFAIASDRFQTAVTVFGRQVDAFVSQNVQTPNGNRVGGQTANETAQFFNEADRASLNSFVGATQSLSQAVQQLSQSSVSVNLAPATVNVNVTSSDLLNSLGPAVQRAVNGAISNKFNDMAEKLDQGTPVTDAFRSTGR